MPIEETSAAARRLLQERADGTRTEAMIESAIAGIEEQEEHFMAKLSGQGTHDPTESFQDRVISKKLKELRERRVGLQEELDFLDNHSPRSRGRRA